MLIDRLKSTLKTDLVNDKLRLEIYDNSRADESGIFSNEIIDSEYSYVGVMVDRRKEVEMIKRKEKLQKAIENLDSTLGAIIQVDAVKEQEEKLSNFSNVITTLGSKKKPMEYYPVNI